MALKKIKGSNEPVAGIETKPASFTKPAVKKKPLLTQPELIPLSPQGHSFPVIWNPVPNASKSSVTQASIKLGPAFVLREITASVHNNNDKHRVLDFGQDITLVKVIMNNLRIPNGADGYTIIGTAGELQNQGLRLILSISDNAGNFIPYFTAPALGPRGMLPPALLPAEFDNFMFSVTGIKSRKVQISLVEGSVPEAFIPRTYFVDSMVMYALFGSSDIEVIDPNGDILWSFPGEMPMGTPPMSVDFRFPLEAALNKTIENNESPSVSFSIRGKEDTQVNLWKNNINGHLVRTYPGIHTTILEGAPVSMIDFDSLPPEKPSEVKGDLTIQYNGIRICPMVNGQVPKEPSSVTGTIVTNEEIIRNIPRAAYEGFPIARVGIIGRAPVQTSLALQLNIVKNNVPCDAVLSEMVVDITASEKFQIYWFEIPRQENTTQPLCISLKTYTGRFFWLKQQELCVKLAVYDDNTSNIPVFINDKPLAEISEKKMDVKAYSFPKEQFMNTAPVLQSLLFVTIDISDIELRYAR